MGDLANKILEIHKSAIMKDKEKIKNHIIKINEAIIECARDDKTNLTIYFIKPEINTEYGIRGTGEYIYYLNTLLSIYIISSEILNYYKKEGFSVTVNQTNIIIDWKEYIVKKEL